MIKSIKKIEFSIGGFSQGNKTYRVEESAITCFEEAGYLVSKPPEMTEETPLSQEQQNDLISLFNQLGFLNWEKSYWENICDGEQWELMITYNGNLRKKVEGSNAYPKGFRKIERLLKRLI
jgi:hypothetical protein